ncbi:MAG: DUF2207 domain-containing protein [Gemmatimonadota bacterium]
MRGGDRARTGTAVWGALSLLFFLFLPGAALAQERILRYDIEVEILPDASLEVAEHITVRAEGRDIRRGIYRDFPTRYRDRYGNQVKVDFEMLGVERDGLTEDWFTEGRSNGIRINTGGDDFLPVPAEYTFTLRYRTTRQLGFFEEHDELYWNAIGTGWAFPIEEAVVEVRLPETVPVEELHAEGYTGPQGAQGQAYTVEFPEAGTARYRLTEPLAPRQGLTVVLTFPKGVVDEPGRGRRVAWFLQDNAGVLVGLLGLLALLTFCVRRWKAVGRDPQAGVIIPRYRPPEGHGPAGLRYLTRMGYDTRCFSGDLLALAVARKVQIGSRKKLLGDEWWLERERAEASAGPDLHPAQAGLLAKLLPPGKPRLELENTNATTVSRAQAAHKEALDGELHPRFFRRNAGSSWVAGGIAFVSMLLAFVVSGGYGIPAILVLSGLMLVAVVLFARGVRARTPEGRRLLDEIEGFKLYLGVAERDELARMPGPEDPPILDAERYEALLPYAVALEVEDAWTEKFTAAVGAAAAAQASARMTWYSGHVPITNLGDFTTAMSSTLTSRISSASSPPGSSSGSGGGGSSGGGGGGGGGGGR